MALDIVKVRVEHEPTIEEIEKREAEWLELIDEGDYEIDWYPVGDFQFSSALKLPVGCHGQMVRVAMRYHTAAEALARIGASLPTKEQADAMFKAAEHIAPVVSRPTYKGSPTSASMASMIAISQRIDERSAKLMNEAGERPLLDNDGKLWLRGADKHVVINYGLVDVPHPRYPNVPPKRTNGLHMWQDVGRRHDLPGTKHDNHIDGTQYVRGVRRRDGKVDSDPVFDAPRSYMGERGTHVKQWQTLLQQLAAEYKDRELHPGSADGIHGPLTQAATDYFLLGDWRWKGVETDEPEEPEPAVEVDEEDTEEPEDSNPAVMAPELPPGKFIQAKSYHKGRRDPATGEPCGIDLAVIHVAQIAEVMTADESLAEWARRAAPVSWHEAIDADSHRSSVKREDTAFAAPGANHNGIQYELAGYAEQSTEDWHDEYSSYTIDNAARIVAKDCIDYDIPIVKLSALDLKEGKRGICGHHDVSLAFGKSTHNDPGKYFPWSEFIALVGEYAAAFKAAKENA